MPNGRDEWMNDLRQQRAEQMRRRYQPRIRRKPLDGGVDRDRSRTITPEQLEHAHDSNAYDLAMYDANQDKPTEQETASSPTSMPTVSDPALLDYENNLYHRLGLTPPSGSQSNRQDSSSGSGKQGSAGSSQTRDANDADRGKDAISVQALLPDIAEVQDDFGASWVFDGKSPDHWHRYNNPEVIRVRQDMERRPLTFKRCFEQAESPRSALEFIYAEPPDLDDSALVHFQDYLSPQPDTMSGSWAKTSDGEDSGTLDIDPGLLGTVYMIEEHLESEYGYQIEWGDRYSNADRLEQLYDLSESSSHIVDFLDLVFIDDPNTTGKEAFRERFSGSQDDSRLVVNLGADTYFAENFTSISKDEAGYYGHVPAGEENRVYLGSKVYIPTIVHEFGHVIDKSKGFTAYLEELVPNPAEPSEEVSRLAAESGNYVDVVNEGKRSQYSFNLNRQVLDFVIEGFVAKQFFAAELWADLFMTAVLSGTDFNDVGFVDIGLTEWWHWPASLEWNAAGNLLAVGYPKDRYPGASEIQIIDVDKLEIITEISLGYLKEWLWTEVAWHPLDNLIAAGGYWGKSFVLDALTGTPVFQFEPSDWPEEAPPNTTIAVCWFTESVIAFMHKKETFVVDVELNKTLYSFETYLWLPPDCQKDYKILNHRGYLIDAKTGAYVDAFEDIAIDPADIVIPLERDDWEPTQYFEFSPDGSRILRAGQGCRLRLYDGHNGVFLAKFPGGIFLVEDFGATIFRDSLAWHPEGSRFAAVGQFGGIRVWDAETRKLLRRYDGFEVSYPALSALLLRELNEEELKLIDSLKERCIEALNSELPEK